MEVTFAIKVDVSDFSSCPRYFGNSLGFVRLNMESPY